MQGPPPNLGGSRYALKRRLGEGGFGVVYEAFDAKYAGPVAVKLLRSEHPAGITRFKREFRSLADVLHPNLVRLYELGSEQDRWYFTMELVDGKPFVEHSRGIASEVRVAATQPITRTASAPLLQIAAVTDLPRLRATMVQLAEGVQALHDARKLHCDLKPANVLVTRDGRVVILDFGLVADVDERIGPVGTPGYVSPEQAEGGTLTPASDWFAVGAMLHEALTGVVPGAAHVEGVNGEASDLWGLCRELIDPDPARRPDGAEVLHRLGGRVRRVGVRHALVGRSRELAELEAARQAAAQGPVLVRVTGPSGIGKTMLVRHYLDELRAREPDAVVLAGRSYEQELVPYKAVDGVIEGLAPHLARLPEEAASHVGELARLFPALGRRDDAAATGMDSQARRLRAFLALREVVAALAASAP
ncbi:MAG: serine/threonine-protein kinase, partial [Acidobacteriota bacterium]